MKTNIVFSRKLYADVYTKRQQQLEKFKAYNFKTGCDLFESICQDYGRLDVSIRTPVLKLTCYYSTME
jgi:hypothetical protein